MMRAQKQQQGFTLIEIMIVVTIIAILGAFAYPSYVQQVRKSKRVDATVALQELLQRQETHYTRNFTYASNLTTLGYATNTIDSPEALYTLKVLSAASATGATCAATQASPCTSYVLEALPKTGGTQVKDTQCAKFTLDNMGRKTATDGAAAATSTTEYCW